MYEMAYAVHTRTCTYLLDDFGVCRWIVSPQGTVPLHVRQCIGAQFVASLDLDASGGLVGDLQPGAMALFVRHLGDRMVLLRTGPIQHVDDRRDGRADEPAPARVAKQTAAYGQRAGLPYMAKPPPQLTRVEHRGEETAITVSVPLSVEASTKKRLRSKPAARTRIHRAEPPDGSSRD